MIAPADTPERASATGTAARVELAAATEKAVTVPAEFCACTRRKQVVFATNPVNAADVEVVVEALRIEPKPFVEICAVYVVPGGSPFAFQPSVAVVEVTFTAADDGAVARVVVEPRLMNGPDTDTVERPAK